jgi:hypothetical protein
MQGPTVSAVAFALSHGEPVSCRRRLFVDELSPHGRSHQRRLIATVEPLELSDRGLDVAATALDTIRHEFSVGTEDAVTLALGRAFVAADAAVEADNRACPTEERDRRVMVGVTAVAVEGPSITIAQVPPTQALLVQDGRCYPLPDLMSWRPEYAPEGDETVAEPLGSGLGVAPLLFRSSVSPGDLILLCDSTLAKCLASETQAADGGAPAPVGTLDEALLWLEDIAVRNNLDEVQAACIAIPAAARPTPPVARRKRHSTWVRIASGRIHDVHSRGTVVPESTGTTAAPDDEAEDVSQGRDEAGITSADDEREDLGTEQPALPFDVTMMDRQGAEPPEMRVVGDVLSEEVEPREDVGPRAPSTDEDREYEPCPPLLPPVSVSLPDAHRATRRASRTGPLARAIATLVALILVCGSSSLVHGRLVARAEHDEQMSEALESVDALLALAAAGNATEEEFAEAESALETAESLGIPTAQLVDRRAQLLSYHDQARGVVRLEGVARIGGLPATLPMESGTKPRLVRANRDLYLVAGGLYRIDLDDSSLVAVLTPGSEVGERVAGRLTNGAWSPGGIAVTDGATVFTVDGNGSWTTQPMDQVVTERIAGAPSATLNGTFYVLDNEAGQILTIGSEESAQRAAPLTEGQPIPALQHARDMVIDGDIHVLLENGDIATLRDGALAAVRSLEVQPAITAPLALSGGMDTSSLWALDYADEEVRLLRIDPDTGDSRAFALTIPEGAEADFATIHDVAVDEVGHAAYFLTETSLWRSALPVFVPVE